MGLGKHINEHFILGTATHTTDASGNLTGLAGLDGNGAFLSTYAQNSSAATSPLNSGKLGQGFITLDSMPTFSFPTGTGYLHQNLVIQQGTLGGYVPIFPSSVIWEAGVDPQPPVRPSDFSRYEFSSKDGGAVWYGARITSAVAPLVFDRFTRANSTTTLGSAEIGGVWTAAAGTWGITGNQAYLEARVGNSINWAETSAANHSIFADVVFGNNLGQPGIVGRFLDAANHWLLHPSPTSNSPQTIGLWKFVAGVATQTATFNLSTTNPPFVVGQATRFGLTFVGNVVTGYVNGVAVVTNTSADLNTNTKVGIRKNDANPADRWDNVVAF